MAQRIRRFLSLLPLAILSAGLGACQVQPIYQSKITGQDTSDIPTILQSIDISDPQTRIDQLIIRELQFNLTGNHERDGDLPYTLDIKAKKSVRSVGITDIDFGPAAFFITISADYVLKDATKAAPIAQGRQTATASYDRVDQEFANTRSEKDADERAARLVAQKLRQTLILAIKNTKHNN